MTSDPQHLPEIQEAVIVASSGHMAVGAQTTKDLQVFCGVSAAGQPTTCAWAHELTAAPLPPPRPPQPTKSNPNIPVSVRLNVNSAGAGRGVDATRG